MSGDDHAHDAENIGNSQSDRHITVSVEEHCKPCKSNAGPDHHQDQFLFWLVAVFGVAADDEKEHKIQQKGTGEQYVLSQRVDRRIRHEFHAGSDVAQGQEQYDMKEHIHRTRRVHAAVDDVIVQEPVAEVKTWTKAEVREKLAELKKNGKDLKELFKGQ